MMHLIVALLASLSFPRQELLGGIPKVQPAQLRSTDEQGFAMLYYRDRDYCNSLFFISFLKTVTFNNETRWIGVLYCLNESSQNYHIMFLFPLFFILQKLSSYGIIVSCSEVGFASIINYS